MFFYNGTADKLVALDWTEACYDALNHAGVTTVMHKIEGAWLRGRSESRIVLGASIGACIGIPADTAKR